MIDREVGYIAISSAIIYDYFWSLFLDDDEDDNDKLFLRNG